MNIATKSVNTYLDIWRKKKKEKIRRFRRVNDRSDEEKKQTNKRVKRKEKNIYLFPSPLNYAAHYKHNSATTFGQLYNATWPRQVRLSGPPG